MAQTLLRPAPLAKVAGLGTLLSSTDRKAEISASPVFRQDLIDPVMILAARSGVAAATIRAQVEAWQIGGAHV